MCERIVIVIAHLLFHHQEWENLRRDYFERGGQEDDPLRLQLMRLFKGSDFQAAFDDNGVAVPELIEKLNLESDAIKHPNSERWYLFWTARHFEVEDMCE